MRGSINKHKACDPGHPDNLDRVGEPQPRFARLAEQEEGEIPACVTPGSVGAGSRTNEAWKAHHMLSSEPLTVV